MKLKKYFFGMFACAALCACSNDDSDLSNDKPNVFTGDEAYINVRLMDAGNAMGRATTGNFEYGTADEHTVKSAHFYFYDQNGNFKIEGSAWNGGTASSGNNATNIEFKSNTVVVLEGLTQGDDYPKYMVTVLNKPENFQPAEKSTLKDMEEMLAHASEVGITKQSNEKTYFVMSTSSYKQDNNTLPTYFTTSLENKNFKKEAKTAEETTDDRVEVYVERLAAKVSMKVGSGEGLTSETINGKTYYKVSASVAGEGNDADVDNTSGNQSAKEDLYVDLIGWKLNATAKKSNIMKNLNSNWADKFGTDFTWNDATNYRSYWGKSFNYNNSDYTYPSSYSDYNQKSEYALDYFNLPENDEKLNQLTNGVAYCAENTNTSAIVSSNFPSAVTSILLKAKVCDKDGKGLDLVRYGGMLYNESAFLNRILTKLKDSEKLNVWYKTTESKYSQITADYVKLNNVSDGKVTIVVNDSKVTKNENEESDKINLYKKEDDESYTVLDDFSNFEKDLKTESDGANGYKGGLMYYNIPIEHLNNAAITTDESGKKTIPEAKYGVVRNHHYVVTINKLEKLGKGIFDPNETIIPNDEDKDTYYVDANINILSWILVNQDVDL